ncbi:hypothetical protein [Altericista sp. CCNU0014]|uniref:hypothetical protein n=1 Tax=Altericista sp. CCNU0014 TaxID=3082949 RepID=UPI00385169E1
MPQTLNEEVSKRNFKTVLRRRAQRQHATALAPASAPSRLANWGTAPDVPLFFRSDHFIGMRNASIDFLDSAEYRDIAKPVQCFLLTYPFHEDRSPST